MINTISTEVEEYMQGAKGVVEANSYETMCLWEHWANRNTTWVSNGSGYGVEVGHCNGKSVFISLNSAVVGGHKVLFIHPTSRVVDWDLIDTWLTAHLPRSAFSNGKVNKTDAMNFVNVFRSSDTRDEGERK